MVAILLGIDKQAFAAGHGRHVVTAVGQIVDSGDNIGLLGIDFLAIDGGLGHFAFGVVSRFQFLAHRVSTSSAHELDALNEFSAWHLQHNEAVVEGEHRADDTLGDGTLGHVGADTTLVHDCTINILDARESLNDIHSSVTHPVLGRRA